MVKPVTILLVLFFVLVMATSAFAIDPLFGDTVNYGAGDSPYSVFSADLNGGSDNDLAVANRSSGNVSILLNNGDGTFDVAVNYGAGDGPFSVFLADLDGDNDNDLAVANFYSGNVSTLLNNGDGTFAAAVNYEAGEGPTSVFSADLDGDNDNDLAVANYFSNNVSILLNNGDGTFAVADNYGLDHLPISVFLADLDDDNDNDLAVANAGSDNVSILFNLTNTEPIPATVVEPDTLYTFMAYTVSPFELTAYLGNFDVSYTANDVNTATVSIDSTIIPVATSVLPSHPAFSGEVLEIVFHAREFILGYGFLFDTSVQYYTVTGEYLDGTPFTAEGQFIFVGHTSGDVNADGEINIADITCLVDYLFKSGPPPVIETINVDCIVGPAGPTDVADLSYLVEYLFKGGPAPGCGLVE